MTETPSSGASPEQREMLCTRYRIAAELSEGKDALEVACGTGIGLGLLTRCARRIVGGDFDADLLETARRHYGDRVELYQFDAQSLPFPDGSFDVVMLLEAIYYVPDTDRFVAEARRVLRPGGALFICSANREWSLFNPSPFSVRYYSARELADLLHRHGFTPELYAGYVDDRSGMKARIFRTLRKIATRYHLIPQTMSGKERIKRLLYGRLDPLPAELTEDLGRGQAPEPIDSSAPVTDHKVLYAIGRLP